MLQQVTRPVHVGEQISARCCHHWIIEPPIGPVSQGACCICEEVREFKNYIETAPTDESIPPAQPDI